jgi:uracil-DNA glycosylase
MNASVRIFVIIKTMKKTAFIGQAMPKPPYPERPFGRTKLYDWFKEVGINEINFYYSAIVSYFPGVKNGSHIVPSKKDIETERPLLENFLLEIDPDIIVPIGKLAISECLCEEINSLNDVIGKKYFVKPFGLLNRFKVIIPLPHPSGASAWYYTPTNKKLLYQALQLLKEEISK